MNYKPDSVMLRKIKASIISGYLLLFICVIVSYNHAAAHYELSIYDSTPVVVWIFVAMILIVSVSFAYWNFFGHDYRIVSYTLSILTFIFISSLPIIRGYFYYGWRDALTHVGITNSISRLNSISEIYYPYLHIYTSQISQLTGAGTFHILMVLVVVYYTLNILFSIYVGYSLNLGLKTQFAIGHSSLLLLPMATVRMPSFQPLPNTLAILFIPVILLFYIKTISGNSRWSILLLFPASVTVLIHPVLFMSVILMMTIPFIIRVVFVKSVNKIELGYLYPPALFTLFATIWFYERFDAWAYSFAIRRIRHSRGMLGTVDEAGDSLGRIGISITEIFIKNFLLDLTFIILTLLLLALITYKELSGARDLSKPIGNSNISPASFILGLFASMIPIGILILAFIFMGDTNQYFRFIGIVMPFVVILGAIGATRIFSEHGHEHILPIFMIIILTFAIPTIFASPYLVQPTPHVTEAQYSGFDHVIETSNQQNEMVSLLHSPRHYRSAVLDYGPQRGTHTPNEQVINDTSPPDNFSNLDELDIYSDSTYIMISESSKQTHTQLFKGEVYSQRDFNFLSNHENSMLKYNNGDKKIYLYQKS